MRVYNIDEVCTALKLKAPVLRKYSALLEDAGYKGIERNSNNTRYYTDDNLKVLRELIDYKKSGHMTLADASKALAERINGIEVMESITPAHIEHIAKQSDVIRIQDALLIMNKHMQESEQRHAESMAEIIQELKAVKQELGEVKEQKANQLLIGQEVVADNTSENIVELSKEMQGMRKELIEMKEQQEDQILINQEVVEDDTNDSMVELLKETQVIVKEFYERKEQEARQNPEKQAGVKKAWWKFGR